MWECGWLNVYLWVGCVFVWRAPLCKWCECLCALLHLIRWSLSVMYIYMCASVSSSISWKSTFNCFFQQLSQVLWKISMPLEPCAFLSTTSSLIFLFEISISPVPNCNDLPLQLNMKGAAISRFMKDPGPTKYQSTASSQMKRSPAGQVNDLEKCQGGWERGWRSLVLGEARRYFIWTASSTRCLTG